MTNSKSFLMQDAGMLSCAASCEVQASLFFTGNCLKHSSLYNYLFPTPPQHTWQTCIIVENITVIRWGLFLRFTRKLWHWESVSHCILGLIHLPVCMNLCVYIKQIKREMYLLWGINLYLSCKELPRLLLPVVWV